MKCPNCKKKITIIGKDKKSIESCPFCKNKLRPKYADFDSLSEGIGYTISVASINNADILKNKAKFSSYLEDILGNSYPEKNLIRSAVDSGIGNTLFAALNGSKKEKTAAVNAAVDQMVREYSTDRTKAYETICYFAEALGWDVKSTMPQRTNMAPGSNAVISDSQNNTVITMPEKSKRKFPLAVLLVPLVLIFVIIGVAGKNKKDDIAVVDETLTTPVAAAEVPMITAQQETVSETTSITTTQTVPQTTVTTAVEATSVSEASEGKLNITETENINQTEAESEMENLLSETAETVSETEVSESTPEEITEAEAKNPEAVFNFDSYSIRNLTDPVDATFVFNSDYRRIFKRQRFCVNQAEKKLYYIEGMTLKCIDLDGGSSELVCDYSEMEKYNNNTLYGATVRYNPFDEKVYVLLHYGEGYGILFEAYSDNFTVLPKSSFYRSLYFTSANKAAIFINSGDTSVNYVKSIEYTINSDNYIEGYIWCDYYYDVYVAEPFIYKDDFYWLEQIEDNKNRNIFRADVAYTRNVVRNDNENCGELVSSTSDIAAATVHNNEVWFMSTSDNNFTVSKLKMDEVIEYNQELKNSMQEDNENKFSSNASSDNYHPYEIVIEGSKIRQTGRNNLNEIVEFDVTDDGRIVVYDIFDSTYKIIEPD